MNMGGPDSLEAVKPFLYNLFSDSDIIKLPLGFIFQKPLAKLIANRRTPKVQEHYRHIGGKSPLREITEKQAEKLETALIEDGYQCKVTVAMRYWHPFSKEAVEVIKAYAPDKLIALSLYPQYSEATTGSSYTALKKALSSSSLACDIYVKEWGQHPGYIELLTHRIISTLQQFPATAGAKTVILFSAHGLPKSYIEAGDPYQNQTEGTYQAVVEKLVKETTLKEDDCYLSYQSRVGPVEWLKPYTDEMIEKLGREGYRQMVIVPLSFVSDHIETLHEMDVEYRDLAEQSGITHFLRTRSFNDDSDFIDVLKSLVIVFS